MIVSSSAEYDKVLYDRQYQLGSHSSDYVQQRCGFIGYRVCLHICLVEIDFMAAPTCLAVIIAIAVEGLHLGHDESVCKMNI